jgi:hypothetical protein
MVEATQLSTKAFNSLDYNDPRHRNWSLSWASNGIAWIPLSPWKTLDVVVNWAEMEDISPGYDMRVFSGNAPDQFQPNYIDFGLDSRIIELQVLDHPVDILFSRNGVDVLVTFQSQGGYVDALYAKSFKIKNTNPGFTARYQLVVIN